MDAQKKLQKVTASRYIDHAMTWIQKVVDDDTMLPSKPGMNFCLQDLRFLATNTTV